MEMKHGVYCVGVERVGLWERCISGGGGNEVGIEANFHEEAFCWCRRLELSSFQQSRWLVEDLDNYHLKELHCCAQCLTQLGIFKVDDSSVSHHPRGRNVYIRTLTLKITCSCLNDVDEDLKDLAMCDFSYDALCTHWLSLKGVALLCSVSRFIDFFGSSILVLPILDDDMLLTKKLSEMEACLMVKDVTDKEIKDVMFGIEDNKAAGPNGYSAKFFKKAWPIVGNDVCKSIKEFFSSRKMLGEMNATIISLVAKLPTPLKVLDFRPIACCNVVYKETYHMKNKGVFG
uniref:RNA-directed DNA polymerase, eukaryota, reverse transcriptase zinc-binding domain protein n=1 Tax=Tanacetum cinerariifolium TaxID=118510 RepID=A0A6L2M0C4_TANCI|nr:RNA-directed DNA polymerase, eukaryota, reverse transcriptase zinc-binding domain protein [Tanacetum cinerariifolium]